MRACAELPRNKQGKIKVSDFMELPILSDGVFDAIDKNGDGYITKGELKLAYKKNTMQDVCKVTKSFSPIPHWLAGLEN